MIVVQVLIRAICRVTSFCACAVGRTFLRAHKIALFTVGHLSISLDATLKSVSNQLAVPRSTAKNELIHETDLTTVITGSIIMRCQSRTIAKITPIYSEVKF